MIECGLALRPALVALHANGEIADEEDKVIPPMMDIEWNELKLFRDFLQPFRDCTDIISGTQYTTLSTVVPLYNSLMTHLDKVEFENKENPRIQDACVLAYNKLVEVGILFLFIKPSTNSPKSITLSLQVPVRFQP